jgi:hypothetical protein
MVAEAEVQTMREEAVANLIHRELANQIEVFRISGFYEEEWVRLVHLADYLEQMTVGWPDAADLVERVRVALNNLYVTGEHK